jgi:hypothetical protein
MIWEVDIDTLAIASWRAGSGCRFLVLAHSAVSVHSRLPKLFACRALQAEHVLRTAWFIGGLS